MKGKKTVAILLAMTLAATALGGCGKIKPEETAVTVDQTEISMGFANFAARYQQAMYDQYYVQMMGEKAWQQESSTTKGETLEDETKDQIMNTLQQWALLDANKETYHVSVTEEEQKKITETAQQFLEDNSEEAIQQLGATQAYVEKMLYYYLLESKMKEAMEAEADVSVSDEDAAQRTFSYIVFNVKNYKDENQQTVAYTEEEAAEKLKQAKADAQKAKSDFDAVAKAWNYENVTYSYGADEENMAEEVIEEADALKAGEVSDLIETQDGMYYVIRLDSEFDKKATEKKKEQLAKQQQSEHIQTVLDTWKKDAKISVNKSEWKKVKFDELFTVVTGASK